MGTAGGVDDAEAFFHWYEHGADVENSPELDNSFMAVLLNRSGIFVCFASCYPVAIGGEVCAIGSGHEIARGAMAMGASPERAVEIACDLDTGSGPPVVVERL